MTNFRFLQGTQASVLTRVINHFSRCFKNMYDYWNRCVKSIECNSVFINDLKTRIKDDFLILIKSMCKSLQQTLHLIMKHWEATENAIATSNQHWTGGPSSCSKSRKGINVYWLKNPLDTYLPFPSQTPFLFSLEVAMWPSSSQWNEEEVIYAASRPGSEKPPAWSVNFSLYIQSACWMWMPRETFEATYWRWWSFCQLKPLKSSWSRTLTISFLLTVLCIIMKETSIMSSHWNFRVYLFTRNWYLKVEYYQKILKTKQNTKKRMALA